MKNGISLGTHGGELTEAGAALLEKLRRHAAEPRHYHCSLVGTATVELPGRVKFSTGGAQSARGLRGAGRVGKAGAVA